MSILITIAIVALLVLLFAPSFILRFVTKAGKRVLLTPKKRTKVALDKSKEYAKRIEKWASEIEEKEKKAKAKK